MHHLVVELFYMKQNTHFHRWGPGKQGVRTGGKKRLVEGGEESFHGEPKMDHDRWIVCIIGPKFGCVLGKNIRMGCSHN